MTESQHEPAAVDGAAGGPSADAVAGGDAATHAEGAPAGGHEAGHGGNALGPVDWNLWGAGLLGILIGLATAFAFIVATNRLG